MKIVPPSVHETAFNCPHCDVLTTQYWYSLRADRAKGRGLPIFVSQDVFDKIGRNTGDEGPEEYERKMNWASKMLAGDPFLEPDAGGPNGYSSVYNLNLAECYVCGQISLWVADRLVYPPTGEAPPANPDMSDDIKRDYDEANSILDLSPRGAAALLRLALQKLCKELGQPGKRIDDDIAQLVKLGLPLGVKDAMDVVRVTGNEAVHPGVIDLKDDRDTARSLFGLLNFVVEKMISDPKHLSQMHASLPKNKREAIKRRDGEE